MADNKNPEDIEPVVSKKQTGTQSKEAERGKKAIDASKTASGEDPASKHVEDNEKKDAAAWRNEG